jgi:hypothetical protein
MNNADVSYPGAQIGGTIPKGETITGAERLAAMHNNTVIQVGRKIYLHVSNEVYVYDEDNPSADWVLIYTSPGVNVDDWAKSGLYTFFIDGVPHVCGFNLATSTIQVRAFKINTLTDVGVDLGAITINTGGSVPHTVATYAALGRIWIYNNGGVQWLDPTVATGSEATVEGGLDAGMDAADFMMWDGDLYMIANSAGFNRELKLYQYHLGSNFFEVVWSAGPEFGGSFQWPNPNPRIYAKYCMWVYDDLLHVIARGLVAASTSSSGGAGGSGEGWAMFNFIKGGTGGVQFNEDLSDGMAPGLKIGDGAVDTGQFTIYVDQEINPGGAPTIHPIYRSRGDALGQVTQYDFNPISGILDNAQVGGNIGAILPRDKAGAGGRSWTEDDIVVEFTDYQIVGVNPRFGFIIHSSNPTSNHAFRLWYSTDGGPPSLLGALIDPTGGIVVGINGNDVLTGLTGGVEYFVTWNISLDLLTDGDRVRISGGAN